MTPVLLSFRSLTADIWCRTTSAASKVFAVPELLEHILVQIGTNEVYHKGMVKEVILSHSRHLVTTVRSFFSYSGQHRPQQLTIEKQNDTATAANRVLKDRRLLRKILDFVGDGAATDIASLKQLYSLRCVSRA